MNNKLQKFLAVFAVISILSVALSLPASAQKTPAQTRQEMKALAAEIAQKLTPQEKAALTKILQAGQRLSDIQALVRRPGLYPRPLPMGQALGGAVGVAGFNAGLKDLIMKREWVVFSDKGAAEISEEVVRNAYRILENEVVPQFMYETTSSFQPGSTPKSVLKNNLKKIEDAFTAQLRLAYPDSHLYIKDAQSWGSLMQNDMKNKIGKVSNYRAYMLKNGKMTRISTLAKGLSKNPLAIGVALLAVSSLADDEAVAKMARRVQENPALVFALNEEELAVVERNEDLQNAVNVILSEGQALAALSAEERSQIVDYANQNNKLKELQTLQLQKELRSLAK